MFTTNVPPRWASGFALGGLLCVFGASGCGSGSSDSDRFSTLDRLRVLGVRTTPADIAPGETATVDALVYAPPGQTVQYVWSWCPSRTDGSAGFECAIGEADFRKAWERAGIDAALPPFDLGTEPTATWTHVLTPQHLTAVCQELTREAADPPQAARVCLYEMAPDLQLKVEAKGKRLVALRTLPLLFEVPAPEERNENPRLGEQVTFRNLVTNQTLPDSASLVPGGKYAVIAEVSELSSQSYVPLEGLDAAGGAAGGAAETPQSRRETLALSWFMTVGIPSAPELEDGISFGGNDTTTYVDGSNTLAELVRNGWQLPLTATDQEALLVLVLRDERGGFDWQTYPVNVEARD